MARSGSVVVVIALLVGACSGDRAGDEGVASLLPASGLPQGGYLIEISGAGLTGDEAVTFGGLPATVVDAAPGLLVVRAPVAGVAEAESRSVDVVIAGGGYTTVLEDGFTFTPEVAPLVPIVVSVEPAAAPNGGGVEVSITAEGFGDRPRVFFGTTGVVEAEVVAVSGTRIDVIVPAAAVSDADGLVDVAVRDTATGHEGRLFGAFQYGAAAVFVSGVDISPTTPGVMVVTGVGFTAPAAVSFAGIPGEVLEVDPTAITVRVPAPDIAGCEPIAGPGGVETGGTRLTAPDPFTFGASIALVTGYETHDVEIDADGVVVADTAITVFGTGFVGPTVIRVGGAEFTAEPDERPPAESFVTAAIPAGSELNGAPGDTPTGVLVNGQGCEVDLPALIRLVRP